MNLHLEWNKDDLTKQVTHEDWPITWLGIETLHVVYEPSVNSGRRMNSDYSERQQAQ